MLVFLGRVTRVSIKYYSFPVIDKVFSTNSYHKRILSAFYLRSFSCTAARAAGTMGFPFPVLSCGSGDLKSTDYDSVVIVTDCIQKLTGGLATLQKPLLQLQKVDSSFGNDVSLVYAEEVSGNRLIFSPTGTLNKDEDDVRRFKDAAEKGIKRSLKSGSKSPVLVTVGDNVAYQYADLVSLLGALHVLYVPLEIREDVPDRKTKVNKLGVWSDDSKKALSTVNLALALESGRISCRDIGGSDPERMAAPRVAEYVTADLKDSCVKVEVISDQERIAKEYPLLDAVNRATRGVDRHRARVVNLTYEGEGPIQNTLMLVGKGVTYDTGGADIKAGGIMAGMHRDKCGAAAVAGFFKVLSILKPKGIKALGGLAMVRNSVGPESYVSDEIIVSRSGVRVRIGNTDAEGRMAMADLLCRMRELAVNEVNPHLFTIATLTGHACIAVGDEYTLVMDNGPARKEKFSQSLQDSGELVADPFEVSTIRREDYEFNQGKSEYEDILQCNNLASSRTPRGHQIPAAFLVVVSGLDKHGIDSSKPIKYSHLDIAGSSGPYPGVPTGAPIVALAAKFLFK